MKTTISKVAFFVSALVLSTAGIGDEDLLEQCGNKDQGP